MGADDDAALARLLHSMVTDLLTWLDDYPDDQADPDAAASIRQSIEWVIGQLPDQQRERLASGAPGPEALKAVTNAWVDLLWWLDTCADEELDSDAAVKLQESAGARVDDLTHKQRQRLLDVLEDLATAEQHHGRRYELQFIPFAIGLIDDEPDIDQPPNREWVRPEARSAGPPAST